MYTVVKVSVLSITDHCPFYKVGDTFVIQQQCFDPARATPQQFCFHALTDIYPTYRAVRRGPVGNHQTVGCMDGGKVMFQLERLPDEEGVGWN